VTVALAVAILIVGLGLLALAGGFGGGAVRRARAQESMTGDVAEPSLSAASDHITEPADAPAESLRTHPARTESPRPFWVGAGVSAGLGTGALIVASFVLISVMAAPKNALTTPARAGGLRRDDTAGTQRLTSRQREHLKEAGMPNPLTAVYRQTAGATTTVLFIGSSGRIDDPPSRLRDFLSGVADSTGASGRQPKEYPAGRLKGTVLCLDQLVSGDASLTTCGWADDGTLGVITTDGGDASKTAGLLLSMRDDMERTS
jgi:hypothetical protein